MKGRMKRRRTRSDLPWICDTGDWKSKKSVCAKVMGRIIQQSEKKIQQARQLRASNTSAFKIWHLLGSSTPSHFARYPTFDSAMKLINGYPVGNPADHIFVLSCDDFGLIAKKLQLRFLYEEMILRGGLSRHLFYALAEIRDSPGFDIHDTMFNPTYNQLFLVRVSATYTYCVWRLANQFCLVHFIAGQRIFL